MILKLEVARVFQPLKQPSRYKGAYGGRGSGKSHFFAEHLIQEHVEYPGLRSMCVREVQRTLKESSYTLLADKIQKLKVGTMFNVLNDRIEAPGDGVITFQGMRDHNAESVKSYEAYRRCWIEEAQAISERSLSLLRPTIREPGSEIWGSWNPTRKADAIDKFLRQDPPANAIVVESNWRDNPWFSDVLEAERVLELQRYPDRYDHTWEGGYARAFEGAYYARQLAVAREQGRIGKVAADPLLPVLAVFDIGGAGANADALAIWICQFVAREIRVLDYIEGRSQVLGYYCDKLRKQGWADVECVLPHDGANTNAISGIRYVDHLRDAGFSCREPIPNQGPGAAMMRVETTRRLFPQIWFNAETTEPGRDALGFYHEKRDEVRGIGLGPSHDWASHAADAFGLMCVIYDPPNDNEAPLRRNIAGYA